jgi:hypothetical protein
MYALARLRTAGLAASLLLFPAASAFAQEDAAIVEEARRLYNDARKAFKDDRFSEAAIGFEAASKLRPHAVALYTAAQAWELAGHKARAADAFARALATPQLDDTQAERARKRLAELEAELGSVVVSGEETTRVQLDDHSEVTAPARLHAEPGDHTLLIVRADGSSDRRQVSVGKGETIEVDAEAREEADEGEAEEVKTVPLSEPKQQPVRVEAAAGPPLMRTLGFVGIGAGVAALGGGILLGLSAQDAEDTYKSAPTQATLDHAEGLESKTNIMLVAGGVLTAVGVGLVIFSARDGESPPGSAELGVGPGGVWAKGRF